MHRYMSQLTHIMQVTECVNIEDIRETRGQAQILEETGEHMPGVSLECRLAQDSPQKTKNLRRGMTR